MEMIKTAAKRVLEPLVKLYFLIRWWEPVWRVLNRSGRRVLREHPPVHDSVSDRVMRELRDDGISLTSLDELFAGRSLLPDLVRYTEELRGHAETKTNKAFLKQLWDVVPAISFENPFLKFLLEPRIIGIVNSYLGTAGVFYYFTLNITTPVPVGSPAVSSQRWHRDPEDKRMIKVFIYLNDVTEDAGPFMFMKGSQVGGRFGNLFPQKPPKGVYPGDQEVEHSEGASSMIKCVGKRGTVVFADTAGIHKGGYAKSRERIMFTGGFSSRASVWPIRFQYSSDFLERVSRLGDETVRFALTPMKDRFASRLFERVKKVYK